MTIQKIGGMTTASGASDEANEYDKWKVLEEENSFDNKVASRIEFRKSLGMSYEEYKKQGKEAGKKSFGAVLDEKMKN